MVTSVLAAQPSTVSTFDFLWNWYLFFAIGAAIIVITMLAFFALRYRSKGPEAAAHHKPEGWKIVLITVMISLTVLTAAEYQTFASFSNIEIPSSANSVTVNVNAFQWGWAFTYPNGKSLINNLTVPAGENVILNLTSRDVFHSFGLSALAVKEDAVPGRVNQLWFNDPNIGFYKNAIRCFELCGVGHAFMIANFTVISTSSWNTWMGTKS